MTLLDRYEIRHPSATYTVEIVMRSDALLDSRFGIWISKPDGYVEEVPACSAVKLARKAANARVAELERAACGQLPPRALKRRSPAPAILAYLEAMPGAETKQVAQAIGIHSASAHTNLHLLLKRGLVVRGHASFGKSWTWTLSAAKAKAVAS